MNPRDPRHYSGKGWSSCANAPGTSPPRTSKKQNQTNHERSLSYALSRRGASGLTNAGLASVNGRQTIRLTGGPQGHVDVASKGPPLLVDIVLTARHVRLTFDDWDRPLRITAPKRRTDGARLLARRPTVRTLAPPNGTLLPTPVVRGARRFHAVGVDVEFDYPADFVPLRIQSTRRAGRLHGADIGVGLGSDLAIIVTQFSPLPVPVTAQNASVLAPSFEREIDALAGHNVPARLKLLSGHPLFDFGAFATGARTLKVYNVFFDDAYAELQCQYSAQEQARGLAACHEMIATLRVAHS